MLSRTIHPSDLPIPRRATWLWRMFRKGGPYSRAVDACFEMGDSTALVLWMACDALRDADRARMLDKEVPHWRESVQTALKEPYYAPR